MSAAFSMRSALSRTGSFAFIAVGDVTGDLLFERHLQLHVLRHKNPESTRAEASTPELVVAA